MRNTLTKLAGPVAVAAMIGSASAATVNIDFGATGAVGGNPESGTSVEGGMVWNAIEGVNGADLAAGTTDLSGALVDSTGGASTVGLSMAWSNQAGLDFSRFWDLHPADRDGDYVSLRGDNSGLFNTFTLTGLTPSASYDVTVYANGATDFRIGGTEVEVIGATNASAVNDSVAYTFSGVAADGSGEIALDWGHISTDRGANAWTSMTSMSVSDVASVPEPSSTALLGLGGLALILRRRK